MVIFFNVPEARNYLLRMGHVYTLRSSQRPAVSTDHARWGGFYKFQDLGPVRIEFVKEIRNPTELQPYVAESGFFSTMAWLRFAEPSVRFLHKVSLLGR